MTETPSQLTQLVQNLYQEMEQGLISAWQEKLLDPNFVKILSDSISLEHEVEDIFGKLLKGELNSFYEVLTLMQNQVERNSNELDEKASEIEQYQALIATMAKRIDNLEKEILQYRIEASETRLSSMERCEDLQQQLNALKH